MKSMIEKVFSIKALLSLLLVFATTSAWADFAKTNPVTGETENYTWKFVGTDTWNGTQHWQNSDGGNPSKVPHRAYTEQEGGNTVWDPILFDASENAISIDAGMAVAGWNLRMGLYNGATITLNNLQKFQGDAVTWFTVDETSQLTIATMVSDKLEGSNPLCLYSARANGITWTPALSNSAIGSGVQKPIHYYLAGDGTVAFNGGITLTSAQVIKQADVTLSEATSSKTVRSKTLVSFASTSTSTFSADAETTIKVKNSDGTALKDVNLTSVTATDTTLTTAGNVGDCELVQTSTGVVLYYVDYAKTYKNSININFTSGTALSTSDDVGLTGYAIPGTSWNNLVGSNGSLSNLKAAASSGATYATAASVAITEARGSYSCSSLTSASDLRHGYIDESTSGLTPTITVSGIPYEKYRVIVYTATDAASKTFGYLTINGKNYTYVNSALTEGTTAWGDSGGQNTAEPIAEGVNVLVSPVTLGSTLTVVGHRNGNDTRGCIAAVQIVEYVPEITENDLTIPVMGPSATYTVDEAKTLSGTVYLVGNGTLTLDGSAKITAATIDVGKNVVLNINADRLDATTAFTGLGTVVYEGKKPVSDKGWTDNSAWKGIVWVKDIPNSSDERKDWNPALYGNADSTLRFTGVNLYFPNNTTTTFPGTVDIDGDGMNVCDGYGGSIATFARLTGSGTLSTAGGSSNGNGLTINDASGFTGTITLTKYKVIVGTSTGTSASGVLQIESGKSITVAGATAPGGFVVNGTLVAKGTLASSAAAAVTGSGTVTFGGVPSPVDGENETKWWKNAGWTGTVEITGASITGTGYAFNDYGNATSTVKLTNCSGWLTGGYTCVPALEIGGTFTWNEGWSGLNNTFKVGTLKGSGTISIPNQGAATAVWQITDDWSGFTGAVVGNNNAGKRVLVFGSTLPSSVTAGEIYISEGATLNLDNASSACWWGVGMGFVVDGTVKASARNKWGGGTGMTLGDSGILEFVSSSNTNDEDTNMSGITGTGTLKFSSSAGWRAFPKTDANMPATTLTIQTEVADSLILPTKNNGETVIGNLAGSMNLRSDWSANGADGRILTVTQSKDTEWQGKFVSNRITQFNVVAPAEGTPGTLTLSGTQSLSTYDVKTIPMQVDGSVNLTGTWVGATTVAGTFGGTGTLTGNLTFNAGSTFKAYASDENGLSVSGTVAYPAEGTVTVDVSDLTLSSSGTTLITFTSAPSAADVASKMAPSSGAFLKLEGSTLKAYPLVATYGGENYATFAAAIAAALADEGGEANLALITVVDDTAELPAGYYIANNAICKYAFSLTAANDTVTYYTEHGDAVYAAYMGSTYKYLSILVDQGALTPDTSVRYKIADGVTVTTVAPTEEYDTPVPGTPDPDTGAFKYSLPTKATTYTWSGADNLKVWAMPSNWTYGGGTVASRIPTTGDSVVLGTAATITVGDVTVKGITVSAAVTLSASAARTLTATDDGIVLTAAAATLTVSNVTLSPTPTTSLDYYEVVESDGTYSVNKLAEASTVPVAGVGDVEVIDPEEGVTSITVPAGTGKVAIPGTIANISGVTAENLLLKVEYDNGSAQTAYYTNILAVAEGVVSLKANGSVTVESESISVKPEVRNGELDTPMGYNEDGNPEFQVKAIPGLWYAVEECTVNGSGEFESSGTSGTPVQATSTTVNPVAPAFTTGTVKYYRIKVSTTGN